MEPVAVLRTDVDGGTTGSRLLDRWIDVVARALGGNRDGKPRDPNGELTRAGLLSLLVYVALCFYPDRPYRLARELFAWGALAALLSLYGVAVRCRLRGPSTSVRPIVAFFLAFAAAAVCTWPFHSADLYMYANAGRLEAAYGLSPYAHSPLDVPGWRDDRMFTDLWVDRPFGYGFVFAHACRAAAWLGRGDLVATIAVFKVLGALAMGLTGALVFVTAKRLGRARPDVSLCLALWSPFLLIHHVENGHNDLWLGLFVLLALRLAADGRWAFTATALAAGALVKGAAVIVLPFVLVYEVRRHGAWKAAAGLAIAASVSVLVSWRYVFADDPVRWREAAASVTSPIGSLHAALLGAYSFLARTSPSASGSWETVRLASGALLALGMLVFLVVRVARALRRALYDVDDLIEDAVLSLIALTCLASPHFGAWYGAMFLPAALLLREGHPLRRLALWLTCFELAPITFVGRAKILDALVTTALPILIWAVLERRASREREALSAQQA